MAGNVYEWVADWYHEDSYARPVFFDPKGPSRGRIKVVRGGSFYDGAFALRASYRYGFRVDNRIGFVGFRCAR